MGIFTALTLFLNHFTNLWSSIIFYCTSEIYSLFFLIVMDDSGNLGFVSPPIYISVKQEAIAG